MPTPAPQPVSFSPGATATPLPLAQQDLIAILLDCAPTDALCDEVAEALRAPSAWGLEILRTTPQGRKIFAALELARRAPWLGNEMGIGVHGPADLVALARGRAAAALGGGWGLALDEALRIRQIYWIEGLAAFPSHLPPRAWLGKALASDASFLAFAVQVPPAELVPTPQQIGWLRRVVRLSDAFGTQLLDCVRWNEMGFHSCATAGLLPGPATGQRTKIPIATSATTGQKKGR